MVVRIFIFTILLVAAFAKTSLAQDTGDGKGQASLHRIEGSTVLPGAVMIDNALGDGAVYSSDVRIDGGYVIAGGDTLGTLAQIRAATANATGSSQYIYDATAPTTMVTIPTTVDPSKPAQVLYGGLYYNISFGATPSTYPNFTISGSTLTITPALETGETITVNYFQ